jgi:hypothetical protein
MKRALFSFLVLGALAASASSQPPQSPSWPQWGRDARHHGMAPVAGQRLDRGRDVQVQRGR